MRIRRPAMPGTGMNTLGTGLFEFGEPEAPFDLGSGLFGQAPMMPQAPLPPGAATEGYGVPAQPMNLMAQQPAAPMPAAAPQEKKGFDLEGLFSNPAFIFGMNLLGASNQQNPWGTAMNNTLQATTAIGRGKREQARMEQEKEQFGLDQAYKRQKLDMDRDQHSATNATQARFAENTLRRLDLDEREYAARLPLLQAQAAHYGNKDTVDMYEAQQKAQRAAQEQAMLAQLFPGLGGAMPPAPVPGGRPPQAVGAPAPMSRAGAAPVVAEAQAQFNGNEAKNHSERLAILAEELRNEPDPVNQAALRREMNNVMKAGPALGAPATAGAPTGMPAAHAVGLAGAITRNPQLVSMAGQMAPKIEGGFKYDPVTGQAEQLPDIYKQAAAEAAKGNLQVQQQQEQRQQTAASTEAQKNRANTDAAFRSADLSLQRMEEAANSLSDHKGLDTVGGWTGFLGMHKIPGEGKDASAKLQTLKSQLVVNALGDLKKLSDTGSSGFGALSEKEGERLETLVTNLQEAQSDEQIRKAVKDVAKFSRETRALMQQHYKAMPGANPANMSTEKAVQARQEPPKEPAPFERIGPRETKGTIKPPGGGVKFLGFE